MKSTINTHILPFVFLSGIFFGGCYTEFATAEREYNDDPEYTSDTTVTDDNVTINNHYYMDDDFRRSRFRLSFNYYYPTYSSSWIGSYYYSYYDDPYWGFGPRWSYYDYGYGCLYPRPIVYNPWWPYYPGYYPGYYPPYWGSSYGYANPPVTIGNRKRADGPSRDYTSGSERSRPIPTAGTPSPAVASTPRTRDTAPAGDVAPVTRNRRTQDETPWWVRKEAERTRSSNGDVNKSGTPRSSERNRESINTSPQNSPKQQARPAERQRRESVRTYNSPSRGKSTKQNEARPAVRQRESRQPSYTPPQSRSSQPSYTPPPSSGSGRSSTSGGSSGRKRD